MVFPSHGLQGGVTQYAASVCKLQHQGDILTQSF